MHQPEGSWQGRGGAGRMHACRLESLAAFQAIGCGRPWSGIVLTLQLSHCSAMEATGMTSLTHATIATI